MQFNLISICLNPSIDLTLWVSRLDVDEPMKCIKEKSYPGGKAINVSKVLSELEVPNKILGLAFTDNFKTFSKLLNDYELHYEFIMSEGNTRENITIPLDDGKLYKINRKGSPVSDLALKNLEELIFSHLVKDKINILIFSGSIPPNLNKDDYKALILKFKSKNNKIVIDNDIFSFEDLKELEPFIIKPNNIEISKIANKEFLEKSEIIDIGEKLSCFVEHVLVSLGEEGIIYISMDETYHILAPRVEVKSTVGAGDSTLAGFIYGIYNNFDIVDSLKYAVSCGSASVTLDGTDCIKKQYIPKFINKIKFI